MSCFSDGGGGYVNFCQVFAFRSLSQKLERLEPSGEAQLSRDI